MTVSRAASQMGKRGGPARAKALSAKRLSEIARQGAIARWYQYCDNCDGCGWYEGGKTLKTTCGVCDGTGLVRKPKK